MTSVRCRGHQSQQFFGTRSALQGRLVQATDRYLEKFARNVLLCRAQPTHVIPDIGELNTKFASTSFSEMVTVYLDVHRLISLLQRSSL